MTDEEQKQLQAYAHVCQSVEPKDPEIGLLPDHWRPYPLPTLTPEQIEALLEDAQRIAQDLFKLTIPHSQRSSIDTTNSNPQ